MLKSTGIVCCLVLLAAGCGSSNRTPTPAEGEELSLTQVGDLCRHYQFAKNKPPAKLDDLSTIKTQGTNGFEAVRTGAVILRFGAKLPDIAEDPGQSESEEVLAYMKEVPESGGKVLLLNRKVVTMSADAFKAAKLAGTGSSSAQPASTKPTSN